VLTALFFLALLIGATPAVVIFDGPIVHGLVAATTAAAVAIVARSIRPGEAGHLLTLIRPLAVIATVPALWMLIQISPLNMVGLANPIWQSAAAALGRSIAGSISIDTGATLISLGRYLSTAAIVFLATAVAADRQRAEWVLSALTAAMTFIALVVIYVALGGFTFLSNGNDAAASGAATSSVALGVILATASAVRTLERYETRRANREQSFGRFVLTFTACLAAIAMCSFAVALVATGQAIFAAACGVATLATVIVIRRFGLGPWGYSAIAAAALVGAISIVALQPRDRTADLTLAFAAHAPAPLVAITQRILMETSWSGTGAGTFAALLPIYRDIDELMIGPAAPTAAAAIAVEMGRPALWAMVITAIALIMTLLRAALRRGRDSFYPAAGAGCLVALMLLAFGNAGLFSTAVSIVAAAILGVAFAQSKSRSIQ
jgi:hypothetical protein